MKKLPLVITSAVAIIASVTTPMSAAAKHTFSASEKKEIQNIVKAYIINNPEILLKAGETLKKREIKKILDKAQATVVKQANALVNDSVSPSTGDPSARVTVIEFYDYQCIACHKQAQVMQQFIKNNPHVHYIFRQLPIFGAASQYAAKVAVLAHRQGKFDDFSQKLFDSHLLEGQLTKEAVDKIAQSASVDLPADMDSDASVAKIDDYFTQTIDLAKSLGFPGTPGIIVMPTSRHPDSSKVSVFLGYTSASALQEAIKKAE